MPRAKTGEEVELIADEVGVVGRDLSKRKYNSTDDPSDTNKAKVPSPSPASKLAQLPPHLMARPNGRSKDWCEYDKPNCESEELYNRAISCSQDAFEPHLCELSVACDCGKGAHAPVKLLSITLSTRGRRYQRSVVRLLRTRDIHFRTGEVTTARTFIFNQLPAQWGGGGTDRKKNRDKFEALINSSTDSDLKGFLQEGIFSLNHLPELLRRLVELGRSAVVVVPAPAPSPAPAPAPAPAPSQADLNEDGHYDVEAALGSHCRIDLLLR
jgi:hypothetical protein